MEFVPHHQCFLYEGSPDLNIPCLGKALREMLTRNYRCLYLNCEPMTDAMQAFLAGTGVDVVREMERGSLVLSSDREHLLHGRFDLKSMLRGLEDTLERSLADGYAGLFATGDMSWEFGPEADFSELMEYEWKLEEFFEAHPQLSGICQYHANSLPPEVMKQGLTAHPAIFVNEELSIPNPHFKRVKAAAGC
jgi:hypothetical protein